MYKYNGNDGIEGIEGNEGNEGNSNDGIEYESEDNGIECYMY